MFALYLLTSYKQWFLAGAIQMKSEISAIFNFHIIFSDITAVDCNLDLTRFESSFLCQLGYTLVIY